MGIPSHLRCEQVVEVVTDYLERALATADAEKLEQHLLICTGCAEYVAQMRAVLKQTRALGPKASEPVDAQTATRLLDAFRKQRGKDGA